MNETSFIDDKANAETAGKLMVTLRMYDGFQYGEFVIEPGYKARGDEQDVLKEVISIMKKWKDKVL